MANPWSIELDEYLYYCCPQCDEKCKTKPQFIGMISHKKSIITILSHNHKIKNFIIKFDFFHKKI